MGRALVEAFAEVGAAGAMEKVMRTACEESFEFGLIGVDAAGEVAIGYSTQAMSWAALEDGVQRTFLSHPVPRTV
jgi:isoaspartyl peptidase/L-asparaginase-like protein (Ntn-hydrolase superfamily)